MTTQKWRFAEKFITLHPHRRNSADGMPVGNRLSRFRLPQLSQSFAIKFLAACTLLTALQIALEYQNIHHLLLNQVEHRAEAVAGNFRLLSNINQRFSLTQAKRLASWTVNTVDDVEQIYLVSPQFKIVANASRNEVKPANNAQDILSEPEIRNALTRSFKDHSSHHIEIMRDGLLLHAHIVPLSRLGVSMIETINLVSVRQEVFNTVAGSTMRRIGVMLVLLVVIFVIMRQTVLSPLSSLTRAIKSSRQNGSYDPPHDMPQNEIGDLSRTFTEVFDELNHSHEENERLAQVANGTHAGVLIADASGRIMWMNGSFMQKTGYEANEIQGHTPTEIAKKGYSIGAVKALAQAMQSGIGCNIEIFNRSRSGKPYWATVEIRPIRTSTGEIKSFIVVEIDITEFKNVESALKKSQQQIEERVHELQETQKVLEDERSKLGQTEKELVAAKNEAERASSAKSDFLATMSHEIRTPMNGVIGIADILMHSSLDERQREQVELIKESGENLLTIINNILDHSKLEAGRFELENDACSPREVTRFVIDLMQKAADEKGLEFESRIADDAPPFFLGDNKRLCQILINLVSNAIKFTPSGSVKLDIFLNSATDSTESNIVFAVRDTGIGIPDSLLPQLFNRYKQANASTARTHGGTGLGLAISKELATLMNGDIEVASVQGVGTTFSLVLPLKPVAGQAAPTPEKEAEEVTAPEKSAAKKVAPTTAKLSILLAEDQPVNQKLMRAVMEQLGHDLTIAINGVEAVKALRTSTFDLVLMDIQMPELDGILATKIIRSADEEWNRIPIIALTAHAMENHKQAYFAAGMDGFVSKPFRMDILVKEIDRVLREAQGNTLSHEITMPEDPCSPSDLDNEISAMPAEGTKAKALTDMLDELENMGI